MSKALQAAARAENNPDVFFPVLQLRLQKGSYVLSLIR